LTATRFRHLRPFTGFGVCFPSNSCLRTCPSPTLRLFSTKYIIYRNTKEWLLMLILVYIVEHLSTKNYSCQLQNMVVDLNSKKKVYHYSSIKTTWLRPLSLALYKASSATASISSAVLSLLVLVAPILTVILTSPDLVIIL